VSCDTRYPIVLVHGIALRDGPEGFGYWGDIPDFLRQRGAVVFVGGQEAFAPIEPNARLLKSHILKILKQTGAKKVNIIAHSRGGLESRFLIAQLGMADKVASLTTLATPHRGSPLADEILAAVAERRAVPELINFTAKLWGDSGPDSLTAGMELTTGKMKEFNKKIKNSPKVYYQSYAAAIDEDYPHPVWRAMSDIVAAREGLNDGLVSVRSAKWGVFRGVVSEHGKIQVSHADIIGMHIVTGVWSFDAKSLFLKIVEGLKAHGY
jgi:triacylglycerol lipase